MAGRGFVVLRVDESAVHYATLSDLREGLQEEVAVVGLLDTAQLVYDTYDPETEALVLDFRTEALTALLVRADRAEVLGSVDFMKTT